MKYGVIASILCLQAAAADRPGTIYKIFQFPADHIPRVDGNTDDWKIAPAEFAIGMDSWWTTPTRSASPIRKTWI